MLVAAQIHRNVVQREFAMILRLWRGRVAKSNADAYFAYLEANVFARLRRIAGHRGATLARRDRGDDVDFIVLSRWDDMDAVREYAGATPEHAVVAPEALALLVDFDRFVDHYEIASD